RIIGGEIVPLAIVIRGEPLGFVLRAELGKLFDEGFQGRQFGLQARVIDASLLIDIRAGQTVVCFVRESIAHGTLDSPGEADARNKNPKRHKGKLLHAFSPVTCKPASQPAYHPNGSSTLFQLRQERNVYSRRRRNLLRAP